jgi:hypothetical protein
MEPRNRFKGMNSASLCSLAGRYDNPIPTRFLALIDCLKSPALHDLQTRLASRVGWPIPHWPLPAVRDLTRDGTWLYMEYLRRKCTQLVQCFLRRWTWTGDFKCREIKTGFYRNRSMQTGSSGTLIGWKSGQTTFVPLWDWMEGAWLRTLNVLFRGKCARMGNTLKPPSPTKLPRLGHFPPASQAGRLAGPCSMYMAFLWAASTPPLSADGKKYNS